MREEEIKLGMKVAFGDKVGIVSDAEYGNGVPNIYQPGDSGVLVVDVYVESEDTMYPVEIEELRAL
jgi:hypothetical protein